jgi:hypothetical protein
MFFFSYSQINAETGLTFAFDSMPCGIEIVASRNTSIFRFLANAKCVLIVYILSTFQPFM